MKYTETEIQALATRVDRLEVQNRTWKLASTLLGLVIVAVILMGAKSADRVDPAVIRARTVEAEDFVLKDADGNVHARLSLSPDVKVNKLVGEPDAQNAHGGVRFKGPYPFYRSMTLEAGASSLRFYDEKGGVIWTAPPVPTAMAVK